MLQRTAAKYVVTVRLAVSGNRIHHHNNAVLYIALAFSLGAKSSYYLPWDPGTHQVSLPHARTKQICSNHAVQGLCKQRGSSQMPAVTANING